MTMHDEQLESAAAYALDALDAPERARFEAHLIGCPMCSAEVESFRDVASELAHLAPAVRAPSEALRARILSVAETVRPLESARRRRAVAEISESPPANARRTAPRFAWIAVAASLAIAALGGMQWNRERRSRETLQRELVATRAELAVRDSTIAAFMGPEVHVVSLAEPAANVARKPSMRVYWNHTRRVFIVTAYGLPALAPGRTYQLWAMRDGKPPLSMGTFAIGPHGRAASVMPVSPDINDGGHIDDCALTVEPAGGSAAPSEAPRLIGEWRHVD